MQGLTPCIEWRNVLPIRATHTNRKDTIMARTERRKSYSHCPESNCSYCTEGSAKRPARRKARRDGKAALRRELANA
jgi:hypothetical protein